MPGSLHSAHLSRALQAGWRIAAAEPIKSDTPHPTTASDGEATVNRPPWRVVDDLSAEELPQLELTPLRR